MNLSARPLRSTKADSRLFVDRAHELDRIERSLAGGLNTLVVGAPGSGRSSLINRLEYRLRSERPEPHVRVGAGAVEDVATFLSLLHYRLLGDQRISAPEAVARSLQSLGSTLGGDAVISLATPQQETERLLQLLDVVGQAASRSPGRVVLVDGLDDPSIVHRMFGRFRDEMWELPLRWVVTGESERRAVLLQPPADAFFETVVELGSLDDSSALSLLQRRDAEGSLGPEASAIVVREGAGNPARLLALARRFVIDGVSTDDFEAGRLWRAQRLAQLPRSAERLDEWLQGHGPASASDEALLRDLGWSRSRATQVFGQLERAGLVHATRGGSAGSTRRVFEAVEGASP